MSTTETITTETENPNPVEPEQEEASEIGQKNPAGHPEFRMGQFTIARKIGVVICIGLLALGGVAGVSLTQMEAIKYEIESIAERDIPLTEIVTKITVHQLEQAINFERAVRYGEEKEHIAASAAKFEASIEKFSKLSAKVNKEIIEGEELAEHALNTSHTEAEKKEFAHVLEVLKEVEQQHKVYDEHAYSAFALLKDHKMAKR